VTKKKTTPEIVENSKELAILEAEISKPSRKRPNHPSHTEVNPLTAAEERGRRRKHPHSKAKKYDGRHYSKNAVVARQASREALENFYKEVKMPELKQALEVSNDPRYNMLLAAINNPRFNNCSFAELCRKCRMSIQDVVDLWRNHLKTKGIVRMMGHLPDIMEDVAVDSKSRMVTCDKCQGEGKLYGQTINRVEDPICPDCHGDGVIRVQGDKDARLLTFETVGLRKGSVGQVNVLNVNKGIPSMEDQIASLDKVFDADYTMVEEDGNERQSVGNDFGRNEAGNKAASAPSSEPGAPSIRPHTYLPGSDEEGGDDAPADPTDYSS